MSARSALLLAAAFGFLGVVTGAFGAHALRHRLGAEWLAIWHTAVEYQFYHALALLAVGLWLRAAPTPGLALAAWSFTVGILVFSGSLYLLVLSQARWLGAVTPLGGLAFLLGWAAVAFAAWRGGSGR